MKQSLIMIAATLTLVVGCTENEEKVSDISRLSETDNMLPASVLAEPDKTLEAKFAANAPAIEKHSSLSATIGRTNGQFTLKSIKWEEGKVTFNVHTETGGTFYYSKKFKCTSSGFFFCKSGYDQDYRFKLRGPDTEEYFISVVEGYPRKYMKMNDKGEMVEDTRESVTAVENGEYNLLFEGVPQSAMRNFDLYEDYCSTSNSNQWNICDVETQYFEEELTEQKKILDYFQSYDFKTFSIDFLEQMYEQYKKYDDLRELLAKAILHRLVQTNSITRLHQFNTKFGAHMKAVDESIEKIFSLVKVKDSVAGYEWFIENYSDTEWAIDALEQIHQIMYSNSEKLDTITSYNTFVINYPTAKQVTLALERSMELERELYTSLGLMSFIGTDDKMEKKARKLLIRAKQIERYPVDNKLRYNEKTGYFMVANRMYDLLQQEFDETEATLRHLESQEFKDFVKELRSSLENIQRTLEQIQDNTSRVADYAQEVVNVSKKGFSDANADRAMSAYYTNKHREWEKLMHYRDHGYN